MKKESIQHLLNSRVKAVCVYPGDKILVFIGRIISITDDALRLFDEREGREIIIDLSVIKEVWNYEN